jgi:PAS domain S-box-containing protein
MNTLSAMLRRNLVGVVLALALLAGLFVLGQANYLLFHTLAELFSVVIASTIFVLVWNGRRFIHNGYLIFLGMSFMASAGLDLLHLLAFHGMGVFPGTAGNLPTAPNLATQLWIAARALQSLSLVIAPFFVRRRLNPWAVLVGYAAVTALILFSIFSWGIFPVMYNGGLTPPKIAGEYVIIGGFMVAMVLLLRIRRVFVPEVLRLLIFSIAVNVLAELFFTEYLNVVDDLNLLGHFFKIISFYLIYKAIVETSFLKPNELFLRELEESRAALEASEARERARSAQLEAIMDAVPALVWIAHDAQSQVVTGNRTAAQLLRLNSDANQSLSAPAGQAPQNFKVTQDGKELALHELPLQRSAASGLPVRDFEETIVFKDGEEYHLLGNVTPLLERDGRPGGAIAAFIDITARVHAEEALRDSEARLRRLVDSNMIGVFYTSADEGIIFANDAFLNLIGYDRADLETGTITWRVLTPPELVPQDERGVAEAIQRGACTPYEKEYIRKDGSRVPVLIGYAYFAGSEPPYICFVVDLTEQKRSQSAIREYTTQLERSNMELARANTELQNFAFVASHDLQEPLRKIQAFGGRLRDQVGTQINDDARDYLTRMLNAAARMSSMINDLLELSRVTTQARPFERLELRQVVEEVLSDLEIRLEKTGGHVEVGDLPEVEADPTQMHQLFQNLIANALKFHRSDVPPIVRVTGECSDGTVRIDVADNGIGFEEQYTSRIFQPFQRLYGMSQYEGSGIGLAICRKIVERHGGSITAQSQPGEGSTFTVILPERQSNRRD